MTTADLSDDGPVSDFGNDPWAGPNAYDPQALFLWAFSPLREPIVWIGVVYLFVGMLIASLCFGLIVAMLTVSLVLALIGIGIPLTIAAFSAISGLADFERGRVTWVGREVSRASFRPSKGLWAGFRTRLTDPARWRQVGYFAMMPVVAPVLFALAVSGVALVVVQFLFLVFGTNDLGSLIVRTVLIIAGLALTPRVSVTAVDAFVAYVRWLLGPDEVAMMRQRVATLETSRGEILDAVGVERSRIERNLHDGVQQRIVALGIDLGLAADKVRDNPEEAIELIEAARDKTRASIGELRSVGRGLHPAILEDRGLDAALSAVVTNAEVPISVEVSNDLDIEIDVAETAYFVAAEAVTNILKHADARCGSIIVQADEQRLTIVVSDDGRGGADPASGTGLAGMTARVRGVDGVVDVFSPAGGPTIITVQIPVAR